MQACEDLNKPLAVLTGGWRSKRLEDAVDEELDAGRCERKAGEEGFLWPRPWGSRSHHWRTVVSCHCRVYEHPRHPAWALHHSIARTSQSAVARQDCVGPKAEERCVDAGVTGCATSQSAASPTKKLTAGTAEGS